MALELTNTITIQDGGTSFIVEDTTVYDTPNPMRASCLVNFLVQDMRNDPPADITPPYDPVTVTEILVPISHDGWYKVTMYVTEAPDSIEEVVADELVKDELVSARFCECKAQFTKKVFSKKCGCEDATKIQELYCLDAQFNGVADLVAQNDMQSADQAIERLGLECALYNKDCGCH